VRVSRRRIEEARAAKDRTLRDLGRAARPGNEVVERLRSQQEELIKRGQVYVEQGMETRKQVLQDIATLRAETGKGFGELVGTVTEAWSQALQAYYKNFRNPLVADLQTVANGGVTTSSRQQEDTGARRAAGYYGEVSAPTQFVAGDAGTEHVVVIKNPKKGTMAWGGYGGGGGGGGGGVTIGAINLNISGTKEMDEEKLATAVERRITTKLSMVGGRQ